MAKGIDERVDGAFSRFDGIFDRLFGVGEYEQPFTYGPSPWISEPAVEGSAAAVESGAPGYTEVAGMSSSRMRPTIRYSPARMSKNQEIAFGLYTEDFPGVTKYVLKALDDPQSREKYNGKDVAEADRGKPITDDDIAKVAGYLRSVRDLTRTKVKLTNKAENLVLMEDGNRAIYFDGKDTLCDGAEVTIYPIDVESGDPIYGLATAAKVKMYKADTEGEFSTVGISAKLARKFFGPKYLTSELKPGLKRGLPIKIELLKGRPYANPTEVTEKRALPSPEEMFGFLNSLYPARTNESENKRQA